MQLGMSAWQEDKMRFHDKVAVKLYCVANLLQSHRYINYNESQPPTEEVLICLQTS